MKKIPLFFLLLLATVDVFAVAPDDAITEVIQQTLSVNELQASSALETHIRSNTLLVKFYESRAYQPAWLENGIPMEPVRDLMNAIQQSDREGLTPEDYHFSTIRDLIRNLEKYSSSDPAEAAKLELLLTDGFLAYGSDLISGRINPYDVDDDWFAGRRTGDLPAVLNKALESGDIRQTLRDVLPTLPEYNRMRDALARYRTFEKNGGWPVVPEGPSIAKGDRDPRVPILRERLIKEGDLNQKLNSKELFDRALERGLMHFQRRNGLDADGVLGKTTLQALNVPAKARVMQIRVNMERCRWLPSSLGRKHIFVNIPAFHLEVRDEGRAVLEMKVVVGRKMRQTPVFSSTMTHMILNPDWTVPIKVAKQDLLQHIHEEPDYLTKYGFDVYANYDDNAPAIDPATINWSSMTAEGLVYKFRQRPGPMNALGRVKFLFPNRFDVYLHDTASRSLFAKTVRDFSSGCIRVEKPVELATYLMQADPTWPREALLKALEKPGEQTVFLPERIPVHLMYWTSWVDESDNVQFRDDLYGRDGPLNEALNREVGNP